MNWPVLAVLALPFVASAVAFLLIVRAETRTPSPMHVADVTADLYPRRHLFLVEANENAPAPRGTAEGSTHQECA